MEQAAEAGPACLPQAGSGSGVSVDLAIPGILVSLICVMCREAGQGFRLVPIAERGQWLPRRPALCSATGLAHRRLLVSI